MVVQKTTQLSAENYRHLRVLDSKYAQIATVPFVLPQVFPLLPTRMGKGMLVAVTAAANTDVTMTHKLGRLPHFVIPLDNGTAYVPSWRWSTTTARTTTTATGQFSVATAGAIVWIV